MSNFGLRTKQGSNTRHHYTLYGVNVRSSFPFSVCPRSQASEHQLSVDLFANRLADQERLRFNRIFFTSPDLNGLGKAISRVMIAPGTNQFLIEITDTTDFIIDDQTILVYPHHTSVENRLIEMLLLSTVLPYWLETQGYLSLHSAAVSWNDQAILIMGDSHSGKSSLCAALVNQGLLLVSDDVCVIGINDQQFILYPAYPMMRLWPDTANSISNNIDRFANVCSTTSKKIVPVGDGWGAYNSKPCLLKNIYFPVRRQEGGNNKVTFSDIRPADALFRLLEHSPVGKLMSKTDKQTQRISQFSAIIEYTNIRLIEYPSSYDQLPDVARALINDVVSS